MIRNSRRKEDFAAFAAAKLAFDVRRATQSAVAVAGPNSGKVHGQPYEVQALILGGMYKSFEQKNVVGITRKQK